MNRSERWLHNKIKSYALLECEIESARSRLKQVSYSVTANYDLCGGGSGSFESSKVETLAVRRVELEREVEQKRELLDWIDDAIDNAGLNKREWDLIVCTKSGYSLSAYARKENIYKSHVYKIRDNALKKMVEYMKNNTKRA